MSEDLGKIRRRKRMSVGQLASKTGISADTIRDYESGARTISSADRRKLARALYVGEWDINPRSSTPPRREGRPAPAAKARPAKPNKAPPPSSLARETQITHLLRLAARFGLDRAALEAEVGKPLGQLTRKEARHWNSHFMRRVAEESPPKSPINRRRAFLPEGVDRFELEYLEEARTSGDRLSFTLFNGERHEGALVGFGPYTVTIRQPDDSELTLNKLAIAYYRRSRGKR